MELKNIKFKTRVMNCLRTWVLIVSAYKFPVGLTNDFSPDISATFARKLFPSLA